MIHRDDTRLDTCVYASQSVTERVRRVSSRPFSCVPFRKRLSTQFVKLFKSGTNPQKFTGVTSDNTRFHLSFRIRTRKRGFRQTSLWVSILPDTQSVQTSMTTGLFLYWDVQPSNSKARPPLWTFYLNPSSYLVICTDRYDLIVRKVLTYLHRQVKGGYTIRLFGKGTRITRV